MIKLKDKHLLITGASKGLGSVCAKALAGQGARLVLMARSKEKLDEVRLSLDRPETHLSVPLDLTDMSQLSEGVKKAKSFLADIDVVLHVAGGGLGLRDPLLDADGLRRLFTLNLVVAAEINKLVLPHLI